MLDTPPCLTRVSGAPVPAVVGNAFEIMAESIPRIVWMANGDGSTDYFNRVGTGYTEDRHGRHA